MSQRTQMKSGVKSSINAQMFPRFASHLCPQPPQFCGNCVGRDMLRTIKLSGAPQLGHGGAQHDRPGRWNEKLLRGCLVLCASKILPTIGTSTHHFARRAQRARSPSVCQYLADEASLISHASGNAAISVALENEGADKVNETEYCWLTKNCSTHVRQRRAAGEPIRAQTTRKLVERNDRRCHVGVEYTRGRIVAAARERKRKVENARRPAAVG